MKQSETQDQTQFATESLLYEQPVAKQQFSSPKDSDRKNIAKSKKRKIFYFGLGFFCILAIIGIASIQSRPDNPIESNVLVKDEPIDKIIFKPLEKRVEELLQELELANPDQVKLPFPPVDFQISLEK